jgi:endonuclease YncB( thermonuclease family)
MRHFRIAALLLFVVALSVQSASAGAGVMAKVAHAINGNTLKVQMKGQDAEVRLYGIATPDPNDTTKPILRKLGVEATEFLKESVKSGWVYLEFPTGTPTPDKEGVIDAFVYCGTKGTFLNEEIIAEGFGVVNRKLESAFKQDLIKVEAQAKASQRGLWGSFGNGGGKQVASGSTHQATYMGEAGEGQSQEVTIWILFWY